MDGRSLGGNTGPSNSLLYWCKEKQRGKSWTAPVCVFAFGELLGRIAGEIKGMVYCSVLCDSMHVAPHSHYFIFRRQSERVSGSLRWKRS
jgi:hypothetical protein